MRRLSSSLPVDVSIFTVLEQNLEAVEGWLVRLERIQGTIVAVERLAPYCERTYAGILVRANHDECIDQELIRSLPEGLYVHGIPVTVTKLAGQWTSKISGVGAVLVPFQGEALALLDEKDRWFVPQWTVQRARPRGIAA